MGQRDAIAQAVVRAEWFEPSANRQGPALTRLPMLLTVILVQTHPSDFRMLNESLLDDAVH
jgi:hypothetical protein